MVDVVIVSGVRTPIGGYGGTLSHIPVYIFAGIVFNEVVKRVILALIGR